MEKGIDYPNWLTEEALDTLSKGYLREGETPNLMYLRLAKAAAEHYKSCYDELGFTYLRELQVAFFDMLSWGWLSPASPVAANFGSKKYLPVSCYLQKASNSIDGIFSTAHEAAMLSKNGGGLGIDVTDLVGKSCVSNWARLYDVIAQIVNQSGVRRGAVAIYCDIDHRDIDAFLHSKELSIGDARDKIYSNIAVIVTDDFMNRLINGDPVAKERFSKVLRLRMKTGSPYIMFIDNANRHRCEAYVNNDLYISQSNLCIEIFQFTNKDHTANCVLSSLNAAKFDEWSGHRMTRAQYTIPELAIFFLDAVQQEFIDKTYNHVEAEPYPGFERSRRAAVKGRALGLGIVGLHSLYQKRGFPFDSKDAQGLNRCLFSRVLLDAERATKVLGKVKGVPEWCRGTGRRNSLLLAVAPTTTNSILCNAGSPGIEPCYSNYFVQMGAKGNYIRRNQHLVKVLEKYGKNTEEVWESIRRDDGSVQGLDFLSKKEKEVFKTFSEISPDAILEQAADRQAFIDQGQSLNLYIPSDASAMEIWRLHLKAWKLGLKGLYYVRSNSEVKRVLQNEKMITVHLKTRDGCVYCESAKSLLDDMLIPYTEEEQLMGTVPVVFINGEPLEGGYTGLCEYFGVTLDEEACSGCEG